MLVAAAVAADELHPGARDTEVEDAGVGRVRELEADDFAGAGLQIELGLAGGEHDVSEATHGGVGWAGPAERAHLAVLDEDVVEGDDELAVDRRPVVRIDGV